MHPSDHNFDLGCATHWPPHQMYTGEIQVDDMTVSVAATLVVPHIGRRGRDDGEVLAYDWTTPNEDDLDVSSRLDAATQDRIEGLVYEHVMDVLANMDPVEPDDFVG